MLLCKPDFLTCIETIRQIKQEVYLMIEIWHFVAVFGIQWLIAFRLFFPKFDTGEGHFLC